MRSSGARGLATRGAVGARACAAAARACVSPGTAPPAPQCSVALTNAGTTLKYKINFIIIYIHVLVSAVKMSLQ